MFTIKNIQMKGNCYIFGAEYKVRNAQDKNWWLGKKLM
jgi:hypothetical protein